jgi:hypothetical protein
MKAASLFVVLALAKAAALWGHTIPPSWWSPVAYLWQDAAIALAFAAAEPILSSRPRLLWTIYAVLTLYGAMTVPVVRVLSSPLTWAMWRAARGPLADSIWYYATPGSIAAVLLLVAAAGIVPLLVHRIPSRFVVGPLMACVALGPAAASRVDTIGLERNAWTALVSTAMPHLPALTSHDWQRTGFALSPRAATSSWSAWNRPRRSTSACTGRSRM